MGQPIGFLSNNQPSYNGYFLEGAGGAQSYALDVNTAQGPTGKTEMDINASPVPLEALTNIKKARAVPQSSIPALQPLPGAIIQSSFSYGSVNAARSSAHIKTDKSANETFTQNLQLNR